VSADGSNDQTIDIGISGGLREAYANVAWQDDQTALLLTDGGDSRSRAYTLPRGSVDVSALQPLAAFERRRPSQAVDEITFTLQ
jgi:hypothetical protein